MTAILLVTFRIIALGVGALVVYLGYRLFKIGYFESGGEFAAQEGKNKLLLKKTTPGVFFALFGAVVIGIGIWNPLDLRGSRPPREVTVVAWKWITGATLNRPRQIDVN